MKILVVIVGIMLLVILEGCPAIPTSGDAIDVYNTKLFNFYGVLITALINIVGLIIGFRTMNKRSEERTEVTRQIIVDTKAEITDVTGKAIQEYREAQKLIDSKVEALRNQERRVRASDLPS